MHDHERPPRVPREKGVTERAGDELSPGLAHEADVERHAIFDGLHPMPHASGEVQRVTRAQHHLLCSGSRAALLLRRLPSLSNLGPLLPCRFGGLLSISFGPVLASPSLAPFLPTAPFFATDFELFAAFGDDDEAEALGRFSGDDFGVERPCGDVFREGDFCAAEDGFAGVAFTGKPALNLFGLVVEERFSCFASCARLCLSKCGITPTDGGGGVLARVGR